MNEKGERRVNRLYMEIKFGGFYSPNPDYKDDPTYITIGIHDGWLAPTKETWKIYLKNVDEVIYGKTNR